MLVVEDVIYRAHASQAYSLACAFEMYHALKIGQRHVVDEAILSGRFCEVIRACTIVANECSKKFADYFLHELCSIPGQDTGRVPSDRPPDMPSRHVRSNISHDSRSNVGALRSHPRIQRQMYHSSMRTPIGPRPPSGPITFTSADHIDSCPSWLGIPTAIDPDSDLDA